MGLMPDFRIPSALKEAINRQPERKAPLFLSMTKTVALLIREAIARRNIKKAAR